jgi:flagellar motor switch protein FliN
MSMDALVQAVAAEAASVIGSLLGSTGTAVRTDGGGEPRWIVQLTLTGPVTGTMHLGMPAVDASTLARAVMALDEPPSDDSVRDTLIEVCGQAVGALSQTDGFKGLKLATGLVVDTVPAGAATAFQLTAGEAFAGTIRIWPPDAPAALARTPVAAAGVPPAVHAEPAVPANLDVILDIDLPLAVRFGETELTLAALTRLAPGSVIDLGRSPDDPVDVLVNGRLVARAEVVVVSGNYGVRITEVISAADRLRSVSL